jgi:monodictyphenone polyketide synthase
VAQYGNPENWLQEWYPMGHLVLSRINDLQRLANEGKANCLSRDMIYMLFNNLVDYADKFQGMQRVVLNGMEAMANVTLDPEISGTWTVAPHLIDSVVHLAGFILNGGNALDPRRNFYVTPGWKTMRFARPLVPGSQFMSYVHMLPVHGQPGFYAGDVYILQDGKIVGLVGGMTFRTFPRMLLDEFFSPPDTKRKAQSTVHTNTTAPRDASITLTPQTSTSTPRSDDEQSPIIPTTNDGGSIIFTPKSTSEPSAVDSPIIQQAMELIAHETEVDLNELSDETQFSSIGVDSLLSLVLVQRFNVVLNLNLHNSFFLDSPSIGDFKTRLLEHC